MTADDAVDSLQQRRMRGSPHLLLQVLLLTEGCVEWTVASAPESKVGDSALLLLFQLWECFPSDCRGHCGRIESRSVSLVAAVAVVVRGNALVGTAVDVDDGDGGEEGMMDDESSVAEEEDSGSHPQQPTMMTMTTPMMAMK